MPLRDALVAMTANSLTYAFPQLARDALEFVLDPIRTARTRMSDLDNVEKTFVGLKLEHFVRDLLNAPKGKRDLIIAGQDVDIKNTVGGNWSIPQETYRNSEPCLLMSIDDVRHRCSLGLFIARPEYLHSGAGNRDTKKGVSSAGRSNILWLLNSADFPRSHFDGLDMLRFRELRKIRGGNKRAAQFFRENVGRIVSRCVIVSLLYDQKDPMKRLRANCGAHDILLTEQLEILIGTYGVDRYRAKLAGFAELEPTDVVCVPATPPPASPGSAV